MGMRKYIFAAGILLVFALCVSCPRPVDPGPDPVPPADEVYGRLRLPVADAEIYSIAVAERYLYVAGNFDHIGGQSGGASLFDATTGLPVSGVVSPEVNGQVYAIASDGSGAWFVGGSFSSARGVARNGLAKIKSDGTVADWNTTTRLDVVNKIKLAGTTLLLTGSANLGEQWLVAVSAADGSLLWEKRFDGNVYAIESDGTTVYAGGNYLWYDYQGSEETRRDRLAALSVSDGSLLSWDPQANGTVLDLKLANSLLYVAGMFSTIGGQTRYCLAAIDPDIASSGNATSWNPFLLADAVGRVQSVDFSGGTVWIAGSFTKVGGQNRDQVAGISAANHTVLDTLSLSFLGECRTAHVWNGRLYLVGTYVKVDSEQRFGLAAIELSTGNLTAWSPGKHRNEGVYAFAANGNQLFLGGDVIALGGVYRNGLGRVDLKTGAVDEWAPLPDDKPYRVFVHENRLYVGGSFSEIAGLSRYGLAAFSNANGSILASSWDARLQAGSSVLALAGDTGRLFVGGTFTNIGGAARNYLAALDTTTGDALPFNPNPNNYVTSLALSGARLFIGGAFNQIQGDARDYLAAFDLSGATADNKWGLNAIWQAALDAYPSVVFVAGTRLYVGGDFLQANGQAAAYLAAFDATLADSLSVDRPNGPVNAIALRGSTLYAAGSFTSVAGQAKTNLAAWDAETGSLVAGWTAGLSDYTNALVVYNDALYVAGNFREVYPEQRRREFLASYNFLTNLWF